jgi:hypothetical protein
MRAFLRVLVVIVLISGADNAFAWIYPEHRRIALLAIQKLSPEQRAILDKLWFKARVGYEGRLTDLVIDPSQSIAPTQLDYASWTAIAGDHSCSPEQMLAAVLKSNWILRVADIAAELQINIEKSRTRSRHINAIRDSDIRLQRADPEYATRAGSNNVHFLLARPDVSTTLEQYLVACLSSGSSLNALGAYSWFHASAMSKAARYATGNLAEQEMSALILGAMADEAFALHFLEDVYASGHTAGTWGVASVRKGTHDYYNENGIEVATWEGKRTISLGDAYMRPEDAEIAATAVLLSLSQFIKAADGEWKTDYVDLLAAANKSDTFNVCENNFMPDRRPGEARTSGGLGPFAFLLEVLRQTPVPGLATGLGEIPRFRSELGMFYGISTSLNASSLHGGFGELQSKTGVVAGIEANVRLGLGLDGVLNQAGDGLVFLQAGFRQDASSSNQFADSYSGVPGGAVTAAIPGRSAFNIRLRLPFWLVPGDMIVAAPILLFASPKSMTKMAVTAANGGLIPWQSGIASPIGRFQFVFGREVGVSLYGIGSRQQDALLIPNPGSPSYLVTYRSTKFDFPILEYSPVRTFSLNQSSSLIIQLTAGFDLPQVTSVILPAGEAPPSLKTTWYGGIRILFDWRRYM